MQRNTDKIINLDSMFIVLFIIILIAIFLYRKPIDLIYFLFLVFNYIRIKLVQK